MTCGTVSYFTCKRCFVSKSKGKIIDMVHPETGLTFCFGKSLDECRVENPDAEEMDVVEFCQWQGERQRTRVEWWPTTAERYDRAFNDLPPASILANGFLVGEAVDHEADTGNPRFFAFRKRGEVYEIGSRPMTVSEFYRHIKDQPSDTKWIE